MTTPIDGSSSASIPLDRTSPPRRGDSKIDTTVAEVAQSRLATPQDIEGARKNLKQTNLFVTQYGKVLHQSELPKAQQIPSSLSSISTAGAPRGARPIPPPKPSTLNPTTTASAEPAVEETTAESPIEGTKGLQFKKRLNDILDQLSQGLHSLKENLKTGVSSIPTKARELRETIKTGVSSIPTKARELRQTIKDLKLFNRDLSQADRLFSYQSGNSSFPSKEDLETAKQHCQQLHALIDELAVVEAPNDEISQIKMLLSELEQKINAYLDSASKET